MSRDSTDRPREAQVAPPKLIEGKYAIVVVFLLGLLGAIGSWWYHASLQRRMIAFWGAETAALIQRAPQVTFLKLEPADAVDSKQGRESLEIGGRRFLIAQRIDASGVAGLIHLRHSLVNDSSFAWTSTPTDCSPQWQYALQFADERRSPATIALDFSCARLLLLGREEPISMQPMAEAVKEFIDDQFAQHSGESSAAFPPSPAGKGPG